MVSIYAFHGITSKFIYKYFMNTTITVLHFCSFSPAPKKNQRFYSPTSFKFSVHQREREMLMLSHSFVISKPLIGFVEKLALYSRRNVSKSSSRNLCFCVKPIEPNGFPSYENYTPHHSPLSGTPFSLLSLPSMYIYICVCVCVCVLMVMK
jgi:hypothetical protein